MTEHSTAIAPTGGTDATTRVGAGPTGARAAESRTAAGHPGRGLGIAGFVLSMLGALSPIGFVMSILALSASTRAGHRNGFATWGIALGAIGTALMTTVLVAVVAQTTQAGAMCSLPEVLAQACR